MKTFVILEDTPGINGTMIADTADTESLAEARALELAAHSLPELHSKFTVDRIDVCEWCNRAPVEDGADFCSESCYLGWQRYQDECAAYEQEHPTFSEMGVA